MGKDRRIFKRRDFIRTGILGSAALSLPLDRFFFSAGVPSDSGISERVKSKEITETRIQNIAQKYGTEFGAIKPVSRRHRNGRL